MSDTTIDLKQALQIARAFNLAFNNAFMYGGSHQTTKDAATSFFHALQPMLDIASLITVSTDKDSIFFESHCVDRLVSVQRINSRFKKAGIQSVSFDRQISLEGTLALFYLLGSITDFPTAVTMQTYLAEERIPGIRINYVVYQKVTIDDAVVNKTVLSENQLLSQHALGTGSYVQADPGRILRELSEMLSLRAAADGDAAGAGGTSSARLSQADYDKFITTQIKTINTQFNSSAEPEDGSSLSPAEMLETIYKIKENVLENMRLNKETGKLIAADELAINEINQLSYQVIVRLIKEEYRNDRTISVKRLAQIIRRMLPDIKELKYLLPQLKDGLFAEGMSPSDYLSLVKELSKELDSDGLMQVMVEASDQIGLSLNELIDGIKDAPEEAARLIVLAAEIKKGGVQADDQQMSAVLSDYIEKVSRALALQSPEAAAPGGGVMLKAAVTRIERELLDRLKLQNVESNMVSEVAQQLANQFSATVSVLKGDWVRTSISRTKNPNEETVLSIIEQIVEDGLDGTGVTDDIRAILTSHGFTADSIDTLIEKAQLRATAAITHSLEIPPGAFNASTTIFFLDRQIKQNARYNTPFSTLLVSYEKVVDLRTFTAMELTPDIIIQLTNQSLKSIIKIHRDLDVVGLYTVKNISIPLIILPMTDMIGALFVKRRLSLVMPTIEFIIDDIAVRIEPKVTVSGPNKKLTPDKDSYLEALYELHSRPILQ